MTFRTRDPNRTRKSSVSPRDAYWHCKFCGDHEPADEPYQLGDHEPCSECGEGTSYVMTLAEGAKFESEIAQGIRQPEKSYS